MRLRAITLVFFLAGCAHAVPPAPAAPAPPAAPVSSFIRIHENAAATQIVTVKDRRSGTAFVISNDGYLLTCAHVVGDAETVEVRIATAGATVFAAGTVEKVDTKQDLALLKTAVSFPHSVILGADADIDVGTETYAIGFPYEFEKIAVRGSIARMGLRVADPKDEKVIYHDEMAVEMQGGPGTSGSGLFLQRDGALIGMAHMLSTSGTDGRAMSFGLAMPVSKIRAFLDAQRVKYHTR